MGILVFDQIVYYIHKEAEGFKYLQNAQLILIQTNSVML